MSTGTCGARGPEIHPVIFDGGSILVENDDADNDGDADLDRTATKGHRDDKAVKYDGSTSSNARAVGSDGTPEHVPSGTFQYRHLRRGRRDGR